MQPDSDQTMVVAIEPPSAEWPFMLALLATAVALGGALAHALELPNKIGLDRDAYFTVQQIYRGWNLLAVVLLAQAIGIVAVILTHRRQPRVSWPAAIALLFLIAAQTVFWSWTFPANQATANWTTMPDNWELLRRHWELSHLVGAVCQFGAMAALVLAVLRRK